MDKVCGFHASGAPCNMARTTSGETALILSRESLSFK
jgi:hypothetical protein